MYLLDTNVVSELRRRDRCDAKVAGWADSILPASMFISAITVLEIEAGALMVARRDGALGAILRAWIDQRVLPAFADRILSVDVDVALRCASLHVPTWRQDRDALIAATALVHRLTVVTRNAVDFTPTGVALLNPWLW